MSAIVFAVCLWPAIGAAQELQQPSLRAASIAAGAAAAGDWVSTYQTLAHFEAREMNPLLRPLDHSPGKMVAVGALIDAGAMTAWNLTMGKRHPKLAVAGLWATAAFRSYLVVHNMHVQQIAVRK